MDKIDVCLAVYNNLKWTQKFIDSLYSSTYSDFDLIVSDNGSTDGTSKWLKSLKLENLTLLEFNKNLGCACGWNRSLGEGKNNFRVLTQNDIQFAKNWDKYLLDFLNQNPECMAVGSAEIENMELSQEKLNELADCFKHGVVCYGSFYIPCIMVRKEIFNIVGWFDENFKTGTYEDFDFVDRCIQANVKFAQYMDSIVCHIHGQTSRTYARTDENREYYLNKWNGKEKTSIDIFFDKPEYSHLYSMGKIKKEHVYSELSKLKIPAKWVTG